MYTNATLTSMNSLDSGDVSNFMFIYLVYASSVRAVYTSARKAQQSCCIRTSIRKHMLPLPDAVQSCTIQCDLVIYLVSLLRDAIKMFVLAGNLITHDFAKHVERLCATMNSLTEND